jgi:hypothetical protein
MPPQHDGDSCALGNHGETHKLELDVFNRGREVAQLGRASEPA